MSDVVIDSEYRTETKKIHSLVLWKPNVTKQAMVIKCWGFRKP